MIRTATILLFIFLFLNTAFSNAQSFAKIIEPNFKGKLKYCLALNEFYYYLGQLDSINTKQLLIYKTDSNGNVLIKKTQYNIIHNLFTYTNENDFIIIADSNRIRKFDSDLNLIWTKFLQSNTFIKKVKFTTSNNYLIDIDNQILILDTAGNIVQTSLSYSDELSDFDLVNDTLYTLSARFNSNLNDYETIVSKYLKNNVKIFEKNLSHLNYTYPKYLVIKPKNNQIISSDGKYFGYAIQSAILNDSFAVLNTNAKILHNFELSFIKYNNNSLLANWYNDKFTINRIYQYDNTLELQSAYASSVYNFIDFYTTKKSSILIIDENGIIIKFKGKTSTGLNNNKISDELKFSPNPFTEKTILNLSKNEICNLYVYDLRGVLISKKSFEPAEEIVLYSKDLPSKGMYLYKIELSEKVYTGKVIH